MHHYTVNVVVICLLVMFVKDGISIRVILLRQLLDFFKE